MKVEYWNSPYQGAKSELVRTEDWPDTDESFAQYYQLNNRLKYCNGSHYKFVSDKVRRRYTEEFFDKYHTIENYYRGGIVD
jgi:hypothetical protein|tara:strand:- start:1278 stop:1520 length:243 start_codon:yes stop_codon:yes gene_type:complete